MSELKTWKDGALIVSGDSHFFNHCPFEFDNAFELISEAKDAIVR